MKTTEEIETKTTTKYPEILSILKELYKYGFRAGSKPNSKDESMDWSGAYNRIEQIINQNFIGKEVLREMIEKTQGDCIKDPFDNEHEFLSKAKLLELLK